MANVNVEFRPDWIKNKDHQVMHEELTKILNFYMLGTPCENTSSSSVTMEERNWHKHVWEEGELKEYLLEAANMSEKTFIQIKKLSDMDTCLKECDLYKENFYTELNENKIVFYNDKPKKLDILNVLFYIRCAFAHGRYNIYENDDHERVYVMEAARPKSASEEHYILRARMILKEDTLMQWRNIIMAGNQSLDDYKEMMMCKIEDIIVNNKMTEKGEIQQKSNMKEKSFNKYFDLLKAENRIGYDHSKKQWIKN